MADEVTTDLIVMFFRTIGSRRYGFTVESFVLIIKLYQAAAAMTRGLASWSAQSFVRTQAFSSEPQQRRRPWSESRLSAASAKSSAKCGGSRGFRGIKILGVSASY